MVMNHYLLLGLPMDADPRQIKSAYRRMAKRFHPDTNHGSEAAAELFRQLNEAYRILTDTSLRSAYDVRLTKEQQATQLRKQSEQQARDKAQAGSTSKPKPEQKFNHFLNSLLDALFEPTERAPQETTRQNRAPPQASATRVRNKPDFNFYYSVARAKQTPTYSCGEDGIYRRSKPTKGQRVASAGGYSRVPGESLLILVFVSLWNFLQR